MCELQDAGIVREVLRAHEYWRLKGLTVDLVILNEHGASYAQDLQAVIETQVRIPQSSVHPGAERELGSVFVLRTDLISIETRAFLSALSPIGLLGRRGCLAYHLDWLATPLR